MFKAGDVLVGNKNCHNPANVGKRCVAISDQHPDGTVQVQWEGDLGKTNVNVDRLDYLNGPGAGLISVNSVGGIGKEIIATLTERGKQYDASGKQAERSMKKIVTAFNAITGKDLTAVEGWAFMQVLKQVRFFANTGEVHRDSLIDNGAYALLQAEEALNV